MYIYIYIIYIWNICRCGQLNKVTLAKDWKTVQPPRGCANLCSIRCTMVVWAGPWSSRQVMSHWSFGKFFNGKTMGF